MNLLKSKKAKIIWWVITLVASPLIGLFSCQLFPHGVAETGCIATVVVPVFWVIGSLLIILLMSLFEGQREGQDKKSYFYNLIAKIILAIFMGFFAYFFIFNY